MANAAARAERLSGRGENLEVDPPRRLVQSCMVLLETGESLTTPGSLLYPGEWA